MYPNLNLTLYSFYAHISISLARRERNDLIRWLIRCRHHHHRPPPPPLHHLWALPPSPTVMAMVTAMAMAMVVNRKQNQILRWLLLCIQGRSMVVPTHPHTLWILPTTPSSTKLTHKTHPLDVLLTTASPTLPPSHIYHLPTSNIRHHSYPPHLGPNSWTLPCQHTSWSRLSPPHITLTSLSPPPFRSQLLVSALLRGVVLMLFSLIPAAALISRWLAPSVLSIYMTPLPPWYPGDSPPRCYPYICTHLLDVLLMPSQSTHTLSQSTHTPSQSTHTLADSTSHFLTLSAPWKHLKKLWWLLCRCSVYASLKSPRKERSSNPKWPVLSRCPPWSCPYIYYPYSDPTSILY